jgi:hypothetical protein
MKTTKPNTINYKTQYQLMRLSKHLFRFIPTSILNRLTAVLVSRMNKAEANPQNFHIDRFDLLVDWGCVMQHAYERKGAR